MYKTDRELPCYEQMISLGLLIQAKPRRRYKLTAVARLLLFSSKVRQGIRTARGQIPAVEFLPV
jgi:hypothetical protein